eukprot:c45867_g1_i1.p1 GENE.c45867_g1_i1~~c45867_g1_i1.p1  ORF type:complete len:549 (-),score=106.45 c45867_g1_i1:85-1731(-)
MSFELADIQSPNRRGSESKSARKRLRHVHLINRDDEGWRAGLANVRINVRHAKQILSRTHSRTNIQISPARHVKEFLEESPEPEPSCLSRIMDPIDAVCRLPRSLHIHSMFKHMQRRMKDAIKSRHLFDDHPVGKEIMDQLDQDELEPHPVRFMWWISILQVIVFAFMVGFEGGFSPFGYGLQQHIITENHFANRTRTFSIPVPKNMWYGPDSAALVLFGAKYTPCMRDDPTFQKARSDIVFQEQDNDMGCCSAIDGTCGQKFRLDCFSPLTFHGRNVSCASVNVCQKVVLRPCCYYVSNECMVASKEECDALPGPRTFHTNAETCSQVHCEQNSCGMNTLASPSNSPNQFWRFFLPIFLHVGIIHLVMNILTQVVLGGDVESVYGFWNTCVVYILSGVGGNILAALMSPQTISVGASSSIYGLMGAQVVDLIHSWQQVDHKFLQFLRISLTIIISLGIGTLPWLDNWAHFGGFIVGVVSSFAFLPFISYSHRDRVIKVFLAWQSRVGLVVIFILLLVAFYLVTNPRFCKNCQYIDCIPYTPGLCDSV